MTPAYLVTAAASPQRGAGGGDRPTAPGRGPPKNTILSRHPRAHWVDGPCWGQSPPSQTAEDAAQSEGCSTVNTQAASFLSLPHEHQLRQTGRRKATLHTWRDPRCKKSPIVINVFFRAAVYPLHLHLSSRSNAAACKTH